MPLRSVFDVRANERRTVALLFLNFFLIIVTYYIAKPVRSAMVVTELGSEVLPYIWVAAAIFLMIFVSIYSALVDRIPRDKLITLTTGFFIAWVLAIRMFVSYEATWLPPGIAHWVAHWMPAFFYLWSDVFSVVMVEQFWSFCNDIFETEQAKRLYGIVGAGGILGGLFGSALTTKLVPVLGTANLLFVSAGILTSVIFITFAISKFAHFKALPKKDKPKKAEIGFLKGFIEVGANPYIRYILILVLVTQAMSNLIDFQFNVLLEENYSTMDAKTTFVGQLYFWTNLISFLLMSFVTAPSQRLFGVMGSLMILPIVDLFGMITHLLVPTAGMAVPRMKWLGFQPMRVSMIDSIKTFDKGLNYSIARASKELLYIPTTTEVKYKAKAVIDMFAFRFSKIISSTLILPFTTALPLFLAENFHLKLAWLPFPIYYLNTLGITLAFIVLAVTWRLGRLYRTLAILAPEKLS
ncbi:MAG: hypothetical protein HYR96_12590 [Deltaproteobacteria bacterium]|nr:hypothetical protein [Deltaproteobacteria bacterium]MBI3293375.1 hypothetical protein [Deltaproteobacteria bacterium]